MQGHLPVLALIVVTWEWAEYVFNRRRQNVKLKIFT